VRFGRDALIQTEDSSDNMTPNHLIGVPPLAISHSAEKRNDIQDEKMPTAEVRCLSEQSEELVNCEVVALGHKGPDGTIVVDHVLCANFPSITKEQLADLSWKLCHHRYQT